MNGGLLIQGMECEEGIVEGIRMLNLKRGKRNIREEWIGAKEEVKDRKKEIVWKNKDMWRGMKMKV